MATRTHAREMVVELLYAYTMGNERIFDFADELLNAKKIRNAQADFAKGLFNGVVAHLQKIDSIIEANLKSWEISRLGVIDKCILRLGVYEILKGEIDAPVAINEAIEIAKILGAENTGKFVNGVLDAISKGGFDLTKGVESVKNSSLGASCVDLQNSMNRAPFSSLRGSNATEAIHESKIDCHDLPKANLAMTGGKSSLRESRSDSKQSKKNKSAHSATESRPIRGAKKQGESKKTKSTRFTKSIKKSANSTKTTKKIQKTSANSSIVSEKSGLRSHERGNKTKASIDEASGKSPRFIATRRNLQKSKGTK